MEGAEEVSCGLIITGGDGTELLELGEEVFDQVPCFIEVPVVFGLVPAVCREWDHRGFAGDGKWLPDSLVSVEGLVGDQRSACTVGRR
jgi:hypothetical protein